MAFLNPVKSMSIVYFALSRQINFNHTLLIYLYTVCIVRGGKRFQEWKLLFHWNGSSFFLIGMMCTETLFLISECDLTWCREGEWWCRLRGLFVLQLTHDAANTLIMGITIHYTVSTLSYRTAEMSRFLEVLIHLSLRRPEIL